MKGQNLFHTNKLHEWPGCRVIIGCRAELLVGDDPKWFAPRDEKGQPQPDKLLTRWVAPFDSTQTENYLKKYVRQKREQQALTHEAWDGWTDWRQYQEEINKLSSIRELIERPFMLTILVDILPAMKREREDSLASISRLDLYDMFMRQWFKRAKDKVTPEMLTNAQHYGAPQYAFRFREGEAIELDYQEFCENLAMYLFKRGQSTALYQRQWQLKEQGADLVRHELDHFFKTSDPAVQLVLRGCPVIPQGMNRYGYLHKSIWEYFVACRVYREISCSTVPWVLSTEQPAITESKSAATSISTSTSALPSAELSSKAKKQKVRTKLRSVIPFLSLYQQTQERRAASRMIEGLAEQGPSQLWFNQRLLTVEPSVVRFLADFAQRDPRFQRTLLHWVNCSKRRSDITIASANAITILNAARFPFSGIDLRNVRIAGADLGLGIFDHTDFTGANLEHVNFYNAFLKGANFKNTKLQNCFFDINTNSQASCSQNSKMFPLVNKKWVLVCDGSEQVKIYALKEKQFLEPIRCKTEIFNIVVPSSGNLIFFCGKHEILVFDLAKKIFKESMIFDGEDVVCSKNGKFIVFSQNSVKQVDEPSDSKADGLSTFSSLSNKGKNLCIYNVESEQISHVCPLKGASFKKTISPDDRYLFLQDEFGGQTIDVFDLEKMEGASSIECENLAMPFHFQDETRTMITFMPNCNAVLLATLSGEGVSGMEFCDLSNREKKSKKIDCEFPVDQVVVGSDDGVAFLYNSEHCKKIDVYNTLSRVLLPAILLAQEISSVTFVSKYKLIFLYGLTHEVQVYDWQNKQFFPPVKLGEVIKEVQILPDDNYICFYGYSSCYIYNLQNKQLTLLCKTKTQIIKVFPFDNEKIFIQAKGKVYHHWNYLSSGNQKSNTLLGNMIEGHNSQVKDIYPLGDGYFLSLSGSEVCIWKFNADSYNMKLVHLFAGVNAYKTTHNSSKVFIYHSIQGSTEVYVFDVAIKKLLSSIHSKTRIYNVKISPDGQLAFFHGKNDFISDRNSEILVYDQMASQLLDTINEVASVDIVKFNVQNTKAYFYHTESEDSFLEAIYDLTAKRQYEKFRLLMLRRFLSLRSTINSCENAKSGILSSKTKPEDSRQLMEMDAQIKKHSEALAEIGSQLSDADRASLEICEKIYQLMSNLSGLRRREAFLLSKNEKNKLDKNEQQYLAEMPLKISELGCQIAQAKNELSVSMLMDVGKKWLDVTLDWFHYESYDERRNDLFSPETSKELEVNILSEKSLSELNLGFDPAMIMKVNKFIVLPCATLKTNKAAFFSASARVDSKELVSKVDNHRVIVFYGQEGCFIWHSATQQNYNLIKGDEILTVVSAGHDKLLLTGGVDGVCRLWDISVLSGDMPKLPVLKWCSKGQGLYVQDAVINSNTKISMTNQQLLQQQGARMSLEVAVQENKASKKVNFDTVEPSSISEALKSSGEKLETTADMLEHLPKSM